MKRRGGILVSAVAGRATLFLPDWTPCRASIRALVRALLDVPVEYPFSGAKKPHPALVTEMRAVTIALELPINPVSSLNSKTGVPGSYRPIENDRGETTCPGSCPYRENGCYGNLSFAGFNSRSAVADPTASLTSAAVSMVSAVRCGTLSRLHVGGDVGGPDGRLQWPYVKGLAVLAEEIRAVFGPVPVAFTYTHFTEADDPGIEDALALLRGVGVHVRRSDFWGPGGAVVAWHDEVPALRRSTGLDLVACPAQKTDKAVKCHDCRLCWIQERTTVVFEPHGAKRMEVAKASARPPKTQKAGCAT